MPTSMAELSFHTNWGTILVKSSGGYIVSIRLPTHPGATAPSFKLLTSTIKGEEPEDLAELKKADQFLRAAFTGHVAPVPRFKLPSSGAFTVRAWSAMLKIRRGDTLTYAQLAAKAGSPAGARAAGQACQKNELPILVPCHRILAAGNRAGGYTGGLGWKRQLLAAEGVTLPPGTRS